MTDEIVNFPRKKVTLLSYVTLPEPFHSYWHSPDRIFREEYTFYDVDGELYIGDGDGLLHHWTLDGCGGIGCFMMDYNKIKRGYVIKKRRDLPFVALDGTYLFECLYSNDYETSVRHPETKQCWVVHSG